MLLLFQTPTPPTHLFAIFHLVAFQISYSDWPIDVFEGDFYDMYVLGRPYQDHYAAIQNLDPINISDSALIMAERLVKKNFLSAYILIQSRLEEYHDIPKVTLGSILAQLGATLNLWAGITVIIVVEFIELLYETIHKKSESNKIGLKWYDRFSISSLCMQLTVKSLI